MARLVRSYPMLLPIVMEAPIEKPAGIMKVRRPMLRMMV